MSNQTITYVVGAGLGVLGLVAFTILVVVPAITAYRRVLQRVAVVVLSMYVLAALVGVGVAGRRARGVRVAAPVLAVPTRVREMAEDATRQAATSTGVPDFAALAEITDAVEAGAGLPEILRTAARALDASLVLIDRSAAVLAVAARSPADERSLMRDAEDVTTIELKVAESPVGRLRMRARENTRPTRRCCGW